MWMALEFVVLSCGMALPAVPDAAHAPGKDALPVALSSGMAAEAGRGGPMRKYAIIIGVNDAVEKNQSRLRYADDDAARFFVVFREFAAKTALFSVLDEETQRSYPDIAPWSRPPRKDLILEGLESLFASMREDAANGIASELYFVYSGHGHVDAHGQGHLALSGGTISRRELYAKVLERSPARFNHLIIDACDAYFFVQSRGDGRGDGDARSTEALLSLRAQEFLDRETLLRHPETGAILSTASAASAFEWSDIRAGIFSHAVRSALLGAADADTDGRISYDELETFVQAATAGVEHVDATRVIYVRPPKLDRRHALFDLHSASASTSSPRLVLDAHDFGPIVVRDDRGSRYLDLNKASGYVVELALVGPSRFIVRHDGADFWVPDTHREVTLADLIPKEATVGRRGADIADAYKKGLFKLAYGPQLVAGFDLADQRMREVVAPAREESSTLRTAAYVSGGLAVGAAATAIAFSAASARAYSRYVGAESYPELERRASRVRTLDAGTHVALGAAISLGAWTGLLVLVDALD